MFLIKITIMDVSVSLPTRYYFLAICNYSCCRVLVRICVCVHVCVFLHDNSKSNRSRNMKLEQIVVYISDKLDIGHCRTKVTARLQKPHLPQYKLSGPITELWLGS